MQQNIQHISLLVLDYDEAINFYCNKLHFNLLEDTVLSPTKRWVLIAPSGSTNGCAILLAKAANENQIVSVGNQTGGRVFLFLHTDDFDRDFQNLMNHNITIVRPPKKEDYGIVAVFADLYGNLWDLIGK